MARAAGSSSAAPRTASARVTSWLLRGIIWFCVFTILFRCPDSPTLLTADSPRLCAPYFSLRSRLKPHLQPYYDSYAARYVDAARPYTDGFHKNIYIPASTFAQHSYTRYAAPRVQQATIVAGQQWDSVMKPRVDQARREVEAQYASLLQPYVSQAVQVVYPPLDYARKFAIRQYHDALIPSYESSLPYIISSYAQGRYYVVNIVFPYTAWASKGTATFLHTRVWPPIRIVYGQNVEPQLAKIRERLSSYRDGKRLETVLDEVDDLVDASTADPPIPQPDKPESSSPSPQDPATSPTTSTGDDDNNDNTHASSAASSSSRTSGPQETANSKIINDLRKWQLKFERASDQGAEDLSSRVEDITTRQVDSQVNGVGEALVTQLEDETSRQLSNLKSTIIDVVNALPEGASSSDHDEAYSTVVSNIRFVGAAIKEKAQDIRIWKLKYGRETESLVRAASDSTLDVIDSIRDLGLQEIGMRWASMEDVSYQDWAAYHSMKKTFDDWRVRVAAVAEDHQGLTQARMRGNELEDRGMGIAQDAAAELARLKSVAKWKIDAHDASDDFSTRELTAAAARLGQKVKDALTDAKDYVQSAASSAQTSVVSVVSVVTDDVSSKASEASTALARPASETASSILSVAESAEDSVASEATAIPQDFVSQASEILEEAPEPTLSPLVDGELSQRVSSMVDSIVVSAGRSAGPKAKSILSAMVSSAQIAKTEAASASETVSSALSDDVSSASKAVESAGQEAASVIELGWDSASEKASSASQSVIRSAADYRSKGSNTVQRVSATIQSSMASASDDMIDKAFSISESIQSRASEFSETLTPLLSTTATTQTDEQESPIILDESPAASQSSAEDD